MLICTIGVFNIAADSGLTENKRRAKYYTLTVKGRQQLHARASTWDRYSAARADVDDEIAFHVDARAARRAARVNPLIALRAD